MATAPKPGAGKKVAQTENAKSMLNIPYDGQTLSLAWQNVPMGEQLECLQATGMPIERFTAATKANEVGEVHLCVLWWLARRAHGEPGLAWVDAAAEWDPTKLDGDVTVDTPDPKGSDPEA